MDCQFFIYILIVVVALVVGWFATDGHKTQWVRLIDVFLYGPFLIWVAMTMTSEYFLVSAVLLVMGATTITYNLKNYLSICHMEN